MAPLEAHIFLRSFEGAAFEPDRSLLFSLAPFGGALGGTAGCCPLAGCALGGAGCALAGCGSRRLAAGWRSASSSELPAKVTAVALRRSSSASPPPPL